MSSQLLSKIVIKNCLKGHKSLRVLFGSVFQKCLSVSESVSEWVSEWVTREPIELSGGQLKTMHIWMYPSQKPGQNHVYMMHAYLSHAPQAVPVENFFMCRYISTDCQFEKFSIWQNVMWKNSPHESVMWRKIVYNLWCFVAFCAVLFQNQCFFAIWTFCVKLYLWRKNYNYQVWAYIYEVSGCGE